MTQPGKPLVFDWGDHSTQDSAAEGEWLDHTYPHTGTWALQVYDVRNGAKGATLILLDTSTDTVPPTITTESPDTVLQGGTLVYTISVVETSDVAYASIENTTVFSGPGLNPVDVDVPPCAWQRLLDNGTWLDIPLADTSTADGVIGVDYIDFGRSTTTIITYQFTIQTPPPIGTIFFAHSDLVASTVEDPDTGDQVPDPMGSADFTWTITAP